MAWTLYSLGFVGTVVALAGWFYFYKDEAISKFFRIGLFTALGLYFLSFPLNLGPVDLKMPVLIRDLGVLAAFGWTLQILSKNRKLMTIGLVVLSLGLYGYYHLALAKSFQFVETNTTTESKTDISNLDPNGELLIEVADGKNVALLSKIVEKYDLSLERAFYPADDDFTDLDDYYLVNIPDHQIDQFQEVVIHLQNSGHLDWLEENELIQLDPMEMQKTLPKVNRKFGINDPGLQEMWGFEAMNVDQLYTYLRDNSIQPKKKAVVAILDTGVDAKHEDINGNFVSIQSKYDNDPRGHGTHCAGIAAAVSNNGVGVASYAPNNSFVQLTSIKVLSASGMGTQQTIIKGMLEAADKGVDVISMSLGGRSNQSRQRAYAKAVKYANDKNVIVVAAAGNSKMNAKDYSPVNAPGVIGVAAIDSDLKLASFSNFVKDIKMGLAAPGVGIYSTIPNNAYGAYNGTSMACPYVAGFIGMMKAVKPDISTKEAYQILDKTGMKTKSGNQSGHLIQPAKAFEKLLK